jgi:protein phosphatase
MLIIKTRKKKLMDKIHFQLIAGTNIGLQRSGNEDNFVVCADLSESEWFIPDGADSDIVLGKKGCLLVVADGMGGMNAGEVASSIAIDTIQKMFSPDCITPRVINSAASIREYMNTAIVYADDAIKEHVKDDPDTEGMGTTIVMAWILGRKAYISWCGDSRAYSFHPRTGLMRLSKDHSYVQDLVDTGRLDENQAFDHPDSNIITRSLGDSRKEAEPDFVERDLYDGEVILLCTDGLSGMLRDREIEEILADKPGNIRASKIALIDRALDKGGYDNVTVALCGIVSGANDPEDDVAGRRMKKKRLVKAAVLASILLLCLAALGLCYLLFIHNPWKSTADDARIKANTVQTERNT